MWHEISGVNETFSDPYCFGLWHGCQVPALGKEDGRVCIGMADPFGIIAGAVASLVHSTRVSRHSGVTSDETSRQTCSRSRARVRLARLWQAVNSNVKQEAIVPAAADVDKLLHAAANTSRRRDFGSHATSWRCTCYETYGGRWEVGCYCSGK